MSFHESTHAKHASRSERERERNFCIKIDGGKFHMKNVTLLVHIKNDFHHEKFVAFIEALNSLSSPGLTFAINYPIKLNSNSSQQQQ